MFALLRDKQTNKIANTFTNAICSYTSPTTWFTMSSFIAALLYADSPLLMKKMVK